VKARQLDSRLATTKTLLENIIDQFPDALFLVDRNGAICFANTKAREEFFEGKALVGVEKIEDLFSGIEKGFLEKDFVLRGEMHYRKGEDYKLYTLESYPIKDEEGKVVFKSLVLKDVADERIEEEENIYRNKMESIGKLAGGIAHDFNNVLTGILGYASLVKRMTPQEGQLNRYAEVIESSAKRAATLTEHLLNFSRRQRTKKVDNIDLNALLGDILFLVKQSFRNITIQKEFDKELPLLKGDAGELQHAFLNLCINAKDAMPEGGTLTIRTRRKAYIGDREFAVVTVEDTGGGIDEELRNKVFEPFFTTKTENNKKLGMGLYLVQKVVRSYGGFIELKSGRDKGTVFTLYFPFTAEQKERPRKQVAPKRDPKKNRILVVDDEKVVRELITGILSAEGFEVLQAKDGPDAIALLKAQSQPVDLVILDMIMPGMDGEEVLQKLREISKTLKVVISSGFMSEEQRDKLKEHDIDDFLDKPYRDTDAITVVKAVLSRPTLISE
jgi:two-component system cell cycle sensor histidine kinase/response regulator CckA